MLKIILPTDFSNNAQNAIDYALFLFQKEICTFYLLHAYHDAPSDTASKIRYKENLNLLLKRTEKKNNNPKHFFKMVLETDSVLNLLNITAIDNSVDYIIMGTQGYSNLHAVLLGSNTVEVIKHLECCPIIAVPKSYNRDFPEEIVFANNYRHKFIALELAPLIAIAKLWNSTVPVIHIRTENELSEVQKENKELLQNILKEIKSEFREIKTTISISSSLYQLVKDSPKIGMIALINTKQDFFKRLLREPIIKNMSLRPKVPLLVLPPIVQ